jgi:hypothetical protein
MLLRIIFSTLGYPLAGIYLDLLCYCIAHSVFYILYLADTICAVLLWGLVFANLGNPNSVLPNKTVRIKILLLKLEQMHDLVSKLLSFSGTWFFGFLDIQVIKVITFNTFLHNECHVCI